MTQIQINLENLPQLDYSASVKIEQNALIN